MSKIICDVCGTTYPETADQCPICGCAKPGNAQIISNDVSDVETASTYTYVKGGRFSKSNVAKRNKAMGISPKQDQENPVQETASDRSGRGLVVVMIILILAIIAAVIFICTTLFGDKDSGGSDPATTTQSTTQETTEDTMDVEIPCEDITLSETVISFDELGSAWLLNVTLTPFDTTDEVIYKTEDPTVADVTSEGRITAIGAGQTTITVRCGEVEKTCTVICDVPTEPTTEATIDETEPEQIGEWDLNRKDVTFSKKGSTWTLFKGTASMNKITFTSDDEKVATFVGGVVTAVGPGTTNVHAEYGDKKVSCVIRCSFPADTQTDGDNATTQTPVSGDVTINKKDVTISVGESFDLTLKDSNGNLVTVTWTASKDGVCNIVGNKITGAAAGTATVSAAYNNATYSCIVRVTGATTDDGAVG